MLTFCNGHGLRDSLTKTLRVVKITSAILLIFSLHVTAKSVSQTITLSGKDISLKTVFSEIKKQSGYLVICNQEIVNDAKHISIEVEDQPLLQFLDNTLHAQELDYVIENKTIIVKRKTLTSGLSPRLLSSPRKDPPGGITGRVTNEQGEPLVGANITLKRTGKGTISDANGNFSLSNLNSDDVIIVSFTGYKKQTIEVGNRNSFMLVLYTAFDELDQVVMQAYGRTTQRFNTGNIAKVTAEEIGRQPVINPLQALQGRVPGLIVTQTSGYASAPFKIELRGRSVINDNLPVEPLYIVDGVPINVLTLGTDNYESGSRGLTQNDFIGPANGQSPFFNIDPSQIESITVLKDADAVAIYGSRGGNGVIIITTKKGKPGKTKLDLNAYKGVSMVTRRYDLLNIKQYLEMRREAFANSGITPDVGNAYDLLLWDTLRQTDYQDFFWGDPANATDIQMSLDGGDHATTFRIGAGYHKQTNLNTLSGSDQRGSVQFNLTNKSLNQKLTTSFTAMYSLTRSNMITLGGGISLPPNAPPIFDAQGKLNYLGWQPVSYQFTFGSILQPYTHKTGFLNSQLQLQYQILKGLSIGANFGYSINKSSQKQFFPMASMDPATNPKGRSIFGNNNGARFIVEPQLEYKSLLSKGELTTLIGNSIQQTSQDGNKITGDGYINDNLLGSISNAPIKNASDVSGEYKYASMFGRVTYNWANKYIINLSGRRDGSSRFGEGKQFGNFGAIGAAWIFTEENRISNHFKFLSFGKFRASYGSTGSDIIGDYAYLTRWSASNVPPYQASPSYVPLQHANPKLQWQVDKKMEFGMHLGFLGDRILMQLTWYRNRIGNQLITFPLPSATGFSYVTANFPATIENKGWEPSLTAKIIDKKDWKWSVNFNIGLNENKLLKFPGIEQSPYASIYTVGQSLNIKRLLHYTGVDPQTGLHTYEDINKDGSVTPNGPEDWINQNVNVKYDGGLGTEFQYRGWQINLYFHFREKVQTGALYYIGIPGSNAVNFPVEVLNRWQKTGDKAKFARYTIVPDVSDYYFQLSDASYSDASFIRLTNASLSYDLSTKWVKKLGLQNLRAYLRGQNLFVLTNFDGADPEIPVFGALPPFMSIVTGIQVNL
jgi:TonB-linked SusC/RagA family outer membrane protein